MENIKENSGHLEAVKMVLEGYLRKAFFEMKGVESKVKSLQEIDQGAEETRRLQATLAQLQLEHMCLQDLAQNPGRNEDAVIILNLRKLDGHPMLGAKERGKLFSTAKIRLKAIKNHAFSEQTAQRPTLKPPTPGDKISQEEIVSVLRGHLYLAQTRTVEEKKASETWVKKPDEKSQELAQLYRQNTLRSAMEASVLAQLIEKPYATAENIRVMIHLALLELQDYSPLNQDEAESLQKTTWVVVEGMMHTDSLKRGIKMDFETLAKRLITLKRGKMLHVSLPGETILKEGILFDNQRAFLTNSDHRGMIAIRIDELEIDPDTMEDDRNPEDSGVYQRLTDLDDSEEGLYELDAGDSGIRVIERGFKGAEVDLPQARNHQNTVPKNTRTVRVSST